MPYTFNPFTGNLDALQDLSFLAGALIFKGTIDTSDDFPTSSEVQNGWTYRITSDVTDNDASKTNTGQSFNEGDEIAWNGTDWTYLGNENLTLQQVTDNGNTTTNNITIDNGGLTNAAININGATDSTIRSTATDLLQIRHGGTTSIQVEGVGVVTIPNKIRVGTTPVSPYDRKVIIHDDGVQYGARFTLIGTGDEGFPGVEMMTDGDGSKRTLIRHEHNGGDDYGLGFYTADGTPSLSVMMAGNGNVGIGTDSPERQFHIKGSGTNDAQLVFEKTGINKFALITFNSENKFSIFDDENDNHLMVFDADSQYVGINTTSPLDVLHIYESGANANIRVERDGSDYSLLGQASGGGYLQLRDSSGDPLTMLRSYGESYFNAGNVGIGTDTPDELLHLVATAQSGTREVHLKVQTSDAGNDQFGVTSGTSTNANFAPTFFGYKGSTYQSGSPSNYIYSMNLRGLIPTSQDTTNGLDFGILNFETYHIPDGDASDPNNAASFNKVNNRRLLSFRNGPEYALTFDPDYTLRIGDGTTDQGKIITGGFTNNSAAFDMALGMKYDTSDITGLGFENSNASGQVRFMAESNDGNYTAMNAPGTSVTGSWLGVARNTAHYLWTNAGRHLAIGTLTSGYDLILGAGDAKALTIDGSTQDIKIENTLELLNEHIIVSGRGDSTSQDVVMKVEDASGTYTGYWGINDGFGNMHIGLNFDENGESVGYGASNSGPAKILFGGHADDGYVSLNAMTESADGTTLDWDVGLVLSSVDGTLRIGDSTDMVSNTAAGLLNGEGKKIADSDGALYSFADNADNNIYSNFNNFDATTTPETSGIFRNVFVSRASSGDSGKIAAWIGTEVDYSTDPTELAAAGLNAFVYHTGSASIGARTTDDAPNEMGGQYAVRLQSNSDVETSAGVAAYNEIVDTFTGTLTESYSYLARGQRARDGTITNSYGLRVNNGDSETGSIVNQYGVYIEDLDEGTTNNYAIYTAGTTPSLFGGDITANSFITSGGASADFVKGDGSLDSSDYITIADAPGSDTQIIFNDGGSFGASSNLSWDDSEKILTVNNTVSAKETITSPGYDTYGLYTSIGEHWTFDNTLTGYKNSYVLTENGGGTLTYSSGANAARNQAVFINAKHLTSTSITNSSFTAPFSVSFRVKFSGSTTRKLTGNWGASGAGWGLQQNGLNCRLITFSPGGAAVATTSNFIGFTDFYHIVVTFDTTTNTVKLYVDGVLDGSGTYSGTISSSTQNFYINDPSSPSGDIIFDEFTFFENKILTPTEVSQIYNSGTPLEPEEVNNVNEIKLKAKAFSDGQFLISDNNEITPVDGVEFDDVESIFKIPELIINEQQLNEGKLKILPGDSFGNTLQINASILKQFQFCDESDFSEGRDVFVFGDGSKPWVSTIATSVNTVILGINNDCSSTDSGSIGSGKFVVGASNNLVPRTSSIVGSNNNIYDDSSLVNKGRNIVTGDLNTAYIYNSGVFGNNNLIGLTGAGNGVVNSFALGASGSVQADYSFVFANSDVTSNKVLNDVEKSWLFGFNNAGTQKNLLQVVVDEGVRIGATSGETITMDGDDLYVVDEIEAGGKITSGADTLQLSTSKTPSSASDTGTTGEIAWDSNYIYVCVATNTWKRSAISTW